MSKNWRDNTGYPNKETVFRFIDLLDQRSLLLIAIKDGSVYGKTFAMEEREDIWAWIEKNNQNGYNLYWSINSPIRRMDRKPKKNEIAKVNWFHVDVDFSDEQKKNIGDNSKYHQTIQELWDSMQPGFEEVPPTLVIFSGNGYQIFWKLQYPLELSNSFEEQSRKAEQVNLAISEKFGGDNCHNIDRIMRLPGTLNHPNEKKKQSGYKTSHSEIVLYNPEKTVNASTIMKVWGDTEVERDRSRPAVKRDIENLARDFITDIDWDTEIPGRFKSILNRQPKKYEKLVRRYYGDSEGLEDTSRSGVEMSLVTMLAHEGFSISQIGAILLSRDGHSKLRELYERDSVSAARSLARMYAHYKQQEEERKAQLEDLEKELREIEKNLVWVNDQASFFNIKSRKPISDKSLDRSHSLLAQELGAKNQKFSDILEQREQYEKVEKLTFYPNHEAICNDPEASNEPDDKFLNLWSNQRITPEEGDPGMFLEHLEKVIPGKEERDFFISYMAHYFQKPGQKVYHAPLLVGGQGIGKSYFGNLMGTLIGKTLCGTPEAQSIKSQFNSWVEAKELVIFHEITTQGKIEIYERIKYLMTEDFIEINTKNVNSYDIKNRVNLMFFSNHSDAMTMDSDDRRIFVYESNMHKQSRDYYRQLFDEINPQSDNFKGRQIAKFFMDWDLEKTGFDSTGEALKTEHKVLMIEENEPKAKRVLREAITSRDKPFDGPVVVSNEVFGYLGSRGLEGPSPQKIRRYLNELGVRRSENRVTVEKSGPNGGKTKQYVYILDDNMEEDNITSDFVNEILSDSERKVDEAF